MRLCEYPEGSDEVEIVRRVALALVLNTASSNTRHTSGESDAGVQRRRHKRDAVVLLYYTVR